MSYASNFKKQFKFKHYINYIAVLAFLAIVLVLDFTGVLPRSYRNILPRIAYSIILAVSLNLVVGFLGELSLGHAGFMCVGAYLGSFLSIWLHGFIESKVICLLISLIVGGLAAAIFGFIIGLPALRLKGDYLAIVTLAFGEIVRNIFMNLPYFGGAMGLATKDIVFTGNDVRVFYIIAFVLVIVVLALIQNLIRSKHGRAITAIRDNEIAAKAMGINVTYYKLFVFIVAAFFAGVAGVIYGHNVNPIIYSNFSYNYSIEILVMVVIGGIGSINGSIIAATLITFVNFVLQSKLSGDLAAVRLIVYALILIVVVIFNNAPALRPLKEKLSFSNIGKKHRKPEDITDDEVAWNRVESKIKMDELLSVDVKASNNGAIAPDHEKGAK